MDVKMNWSSIFLITFLIILSYLKGAEPVNQSSDHVYGVLGHPGFLRSPLKEMPDDLKWLKERQRLARIKEKNLHFEPGYGIFTNGTLKINNLTEKDAGSNYEMVAYSANGKEIWKHTVTLVVQELLHQPQIFENCSARIVTCEVTHKIPPKPNLVLYCNRRILSHTEEYHDGTLRVSYTLKTHSGNFTCKASNNVSMPQIEKEINCSDPTGDMFFYLLIGGSIVVFIVFLAVLIYCIRKKRAERRELEAEERELQARIAMENGLKYRKLPQPPIRGASNQPPQQHKPPPPHSEVPLLAGPPQPRPRPHQKPPRHTREKP